MPVLARSIAPSWCLAAMAICLLAVASVGSGSPPAHARDGLGGPFALTDENGWTVTDRDMRGRPFLIFFGFTHCADVDLVPLSQISAVVAALGRDADNVGALFVTVDPERDDPAALRDYLAGFDPHIRGLTGSSDAIAAVTTAYDVYREKVSATEGAYGIDHTTDVFLVDRNGELTGRFDLRRSPDALATELRAMW